MEDQDENVHFSLSSFLSYYPDVHDRNFPRFIAQSREFAENKTPVTETKPEEQGELLSQQRLIKNFLAPNTPYSKLLLFHKVGVGKCLHPGEKVDIYHGDRVLTNTLENLWQTLCPSSTIYDVETGGLWKRFGDGSSDSEYTIDCIDKHKNIVRKKITGMFSMAISEAIREVGFEIGAGYSSVKMTLAHKLMKYEDGNIFWSSSIVPGDKVLIKKDGNIHSAQISCVGFEWYEGIVYDFEVEDEHCYFCKLGLQELLCHNTCSAIAVAENFKNTIVSGNVRKPALILVKNEGLMRQFVTNIHSTCTRYQYGADSLSEWKAQGLSKETIEKRLRKQVRKSYRLSTYKTFLKKLPTSREAITKEYSNRIIIVDEIHKIREHGKKKDYYSRLLTFLTLVKDCRVLLMTGTPIWERPWELSSLFNLLLNEDKRLETGNAFMARFFKKDKLINEEVLINTWRGLVSFLRPIMTTAKRIEEGKSKPWMKHLKIVPCVMSDYQREISTQAQKDVQTIQTTRGEGDKAIQFEKHVKGGALLKNARDAMNFVYPPRKGLLAYGKEPFTSLIVKKVRKRKLQKGGATTAVEVTSYRLPEDMKKELFPLEKLYTFSCKFASIIKTILENPQENAFVYSENVTRGGAILFSLVLELYGFSRVSSSFNITKDTEKKNRYCIFTSDPSTTSQDKQVEDVLKTFNNPKNKYGDYIRVIIGSEKVSEGFNFKNIRQIHTLMPHWNLSENEQAEGRGLRFLSHDALPVKERYVKIYKLASVYGLNDPTETTDIYIYSIAEEKEIKNAQLHRLLKKISFDCALTYQRNVLETDIDGSRDCDFQICNYKCLDLPPTSKDEKVWRYDYPINNDNYNILFSQEITLLILKEITKLFRTNYVLTLGQIYDKISAFATLVEKSINLHILVNALDLIINSRLYVRNNYGFPCYVKEQGGYYFLDNSVSFYRHDAYQLQTYTSNPIVISKENITGIVEYLRLSRDQDVLCNFAKTPTIQALYTLHYPQKALLLEFAYQQITSIGASDAPIPNIIHFIMKELGKNLYTLKDGTVAHILYMEEYTGISYNIIVKKYENEGLVRIFSKTNQGGAWTYLVNTELEEQYLMEIKEQKLQNLDNLLENKYDLYGLLSRDGKFKIREKQKRKGETKGLACKSRPPPNLLKIFKKVNYLPESEPIYKNWGREQLLRALSESKKYKKLKGIYDEKKLSNDILGQLVTFSGMTADNLCTLLMEHLADIGLLFDEVGKTLTREHIHAILNSPEIKYEF